MPTNYETLNVATDTTTTKTVLHEVLPLTGTIASGTYDSEDGTSFNIKNYTHGMFQSVYDYPFLSSSANHIYDLTIGFDESSTLSSSATVQNSKKINIYNQFSQVLLGYNDTNTSVNLFEADETLDLEGAVMKNVFVIPFSRLITKDQIKKGTFSMLIGTGAFEKPFGTLAGISSLLKIHDVSASATQGTHPALGGDYGILFMTQSANGSYPPDGTSLMSHPIVVSSSLNDAQGVGVVFYQAGIAVVTSSIFDGILHDQFITNAVDAAGNTNLSQSVAHAFTGSSITASCDAFRHRLANISFNNSTEINSTIYFCRLPVNKFNYSSNPSYTNGSKMVVKNDASDLPVAYATTVGLYNARNELLAVAKLSEPLKKTPQNELTLRVRLDY